MPTDKNVGSTLVIVVDRQINTPLGKDKSAQVTKDRQQEEQHRDEFSQDAQIMTEVPKEKHTSPPSEISLEGNSRVICSDAHSRCIEETEKFHRLTGGSRGRASHREASDQLQISPRSSS